MRLLGGGALLLAWCGSAAPLIDKVDPPGWWLRHTWNPVQILLTGRSLSGASITSESKGFSIHVRQVSQDGRYLFAYLDIGVAAKPGKHRFRVSTTSGATAFDFTLDPALDRTGRFQGFTSDDVIYLLMPDRFSNGDQANDSPSEYGRPADRSSPSAYHGGDFRGITQRLGYLKNLGVTGLWLLPIYKNSSPHSSPAHGYHTVDFYAVEPRFGAMSELQHLMSAAHRMGLKVMQDQVANHCGPYHPWVEAPPTRNWFHHLDQAVKPSATGDIAGLADPYSRPKRRDSMLQGWFAGHLPDFNQTDPLASDYIIQNALWWIGMTGIDGIRQDTYPYGDRPFWEKWQNAINKQFPGFYVVGEITGRTPAVQAFFEGGIRRYGVDTKLPAILDFPLYRAIRSVFAQGEPMTQLVDILAQDSLYQRPELLVPFLGNHDNPRFLTVAGGDVSRLLLAQAFLLTTRGIPQLYYGDEIAMRGDTEKKDSSIRADFPGGFHDDAVDAFTPRGRTGNGAVVFESLRALLHFRKAHPALRRGKLVQLMVDRDQYAYLRSTPEEHVLVLLNRAGRHGPIELEVDDLPLPEGLRFHFWMQGQPDLVVSNGGLRIPEPEEVNIYWVSRTKGVPK
jgi:glycosidase